MTSKISTAMITSGAILATLVCLPSLFVGSATAATQTARIHTVSIPDKVLDVEVLGLAEQASWAVGAVVQDGPDAKVTMLKSNLKKSIPSPTMDGLGELTADHAAIRAGSVKIVLGPSETNSVGLMVKVPAGTTLRISVNGTLYSSSKVSTSMMIQDGSVRPEPIRSTAEFYGKMHMSGSAPQPDFIERQGRLFVSPGLARSHLATLVKPAPAVAGCCGNQVAVHLEVSIDSSGVVTAVRRRTAAQADVGPLEATIRLWKFTPFVRNGTIVPVVLIVPVVFANDSVASPLF